MSAELIEALQNAALYPHPVKEFQVLETHISWVILTGDYAYKIKKPMDFGFLDFSTLQKRGHYCSEELRLNQRLAAEIYETRIAVCAPQADLRALSLVEAADLEPEDLLEWAIRMRQFDPQSVLSSHRPEPAVLADLMRSVACQLAAFHRNDCAVSPARENWGRPSEVLAPMIQNFEQVGPMLEDAADQALLKEVEGATRALYQRLEPVLGQRKESGFIRECHGDLHLGNIARVAEQALLFDCIEFNPAFRWIDVINDLAFLIMDLEFRGHADVAAQTLNTYLEESGDYSGAVLLDFYKAYRAMVRCKIALLTASSPGMKSAESAAQQKLARRYLAFARDCLANRRGSLCLMQGLSGSGKTTLSEHLLQPQAGGWQTPGIRIRSDVERKRLAGLPALANSRSGQDAGIYSAAMSQRTFDHLAKLTCLLLDAGTRVIVDATFLHQAQRTRFIALARDRKLNWAIARCEVSEATAEGRLAQRQATGRDAAEADADIMRAQMAQQEALNADEQTATVTFNMEHGISQEAIRALQQHLQEA